MRKEYVHSQYWMQHVCVWFCRSALYWQLSQRWYDLKEARKQRLNTLQPWWVDVISFFAEQNVGNRTAMTLIDFMIWTHFSNYLVLCSEKSHTQVLSDILVALIFYALSIDRWRLLKLWKAANHWQLFPTSSTWSWKGEQCVVSHIISP